MAFAERFKAEEGEDYYGLTYERLIDIGHQALTEGSASLGNNESAMYELYENLEEFWKSWSIITGIPVPQETRENTSFRCAC